MKVTNITIESVEPLEEVLRFTMKRVELNKFYTQFNYTDLPIPTNIMNIGDTIRISIDFEELETMMARIRKENKQRERKA